MRALSVSVDDFGLCAYWLLGRLRAQALCVHDDHVRLQRVEACPPSSLFKVLIAHGLVKEVDYLSKAAASRVIE
jgi:hypothetical protein